MDSLQTTTDAEARKEIEEAEEEMALDILDSEAEVPDAEQVNDPQMGGLPVEDWDYQRPTRGQLRTGIIMSIGEQEIIVDVGAKRDGVVPYADLQRLGPEAIAELSVGQEVPVYVLRPEDQDGNLLISLYLARQEQSWERARELAESGEVWEAPIVGYNKGGLVVPIDDLRGFVPASQIPGFPRGLSPEERMHRLSTRVGKKLLVKVIEINRRKRRLILSSTAAQGQWRKQTRERLVSDLREGEVRRGRISSLCSFGAFVDLGGADGLIHLSELSWQRVRHPKEVVHVGQEVEVYVMHLDQEQNRIGLSLKRLQPEPWALVEDKYELGQLVEGVVTNVVEFGAFAEIEEGIEGLIHLSELSEVPVTHPREVVKKGDLLLLRIIRIDVRRKRLGLSLKRVLESEWAAWAARLAEAEQKKAAEAQAKAEAAEAAKAAAQAEAEAMQAVGTAAQAEAEPAEAAEAAAQAEAEAMQVVEAKAEAAQPIEAEAQPTEEGEPTPPTAGQADDHEQ